MLETRVLSPIAKVFPDEAPKPNPVCLSGFQNEVISFQLAFRPADPLSRERPALRLETEFAAPEHLRVRRVKYVPVRMAELPGADDNYLRGGQPGLYPDPLIECPPHGLRAIPGCWESLWFDFLPDAALSAGDYPLTIRLYHEDSGALWSEDRVVIHLIGASLPKQTLVHTKWLHTDALADYYGVEVFSEEYWRITENFVGCAVQHGINAILTPTHTPPLDTRIGCYRTAVQLVDVSYRGGAYTFSFDKLHRWVDMCRRCGVEYYEIAHLFTQWGAHCAPMILADTDDGFKRIFGWDTPADGEAYAAFLDAYLPALIDELEALGISDHCFFHISDEPTEKDLKSYLAAKQLVSKHLRNHKIMDALSDVTFYDCGATEHPIPGIDHIEPFLERSIPDLWGYYCISQGKDVSNIFIAMPGARTRILGAQMYKFQLAGFLQWGYNFYYAQYSDYLINPWLDTDCDGFSPAGDAFQVYPGQDGQPVVSMRMMHVLEAHQDQRAMQLLETLAGRDFVLSLIDDGIEPLRFSVCPKDDAYILNLRERINREIEKRL